MMRRPSTAAQLYRWHRRAVAGENPPRHEDDPQPGWYRTRLVKGGPFVAARIWVVRDIDMATGELVSDEQLACEVDGSMRDPYRVWTYLTPISRAEYDALIHRRISLAAMADASAPVDLTREPMRPF